jgi:hypothetical protein
MTTTQRTLPRAEAQALARAVNRGAIGHGRVAHWAGMARRGEVDAAFFDRLASAGMPYGVAGDDPDGGEDFSFLWPPEDAAEAGRRQARAERLMASARDALDEDGLYEAVFGEPPR